MRCFLVWSNLLLLLLSFSFSLSAFGLRITIEEGTGGIVLNRPTTVRWSHEPSDPANFDFRFVVGQFNDVGLAAANIAIANPGGAGSESGQVQVIFPRPGRFVIKAVSGPQFSVIGTSNEVEVKAAATSTSTSSTPTSSTSSTPSSTSSSASNTKTSPSTRSGVIAGIVIGSLALVLVLTMLLFFFFRRRLAMQKEAQRFSFHPEQMVQRRSRFLSISRFTFRSVASVGGVGDPEQGRRREGSVGTTAGTGTGPGVITPFPLPSPPPPPPTSASIPISHSLRGGNPFMSPGESAIRALPTPPPRPPATPASVPLPVTPVPAPIPTPTRAMSQVRPSTPISARQSVLRPLPHLPPPLALSKHKELVEGQDTRALPPLPVPVPSPTPHSPTPHHKIDPPAPLDTRMDTTSTPIDTPPKTERQHHLASRLVQAQDQIRVLERNPDKLELVLEELHRQVIWLEEHMEGSWAKGETDEAPVGFARYA